MFYFWLKIFFQLTKFSKGTAKHPKNIKNILHRNKQTESNFRFKLEWHVIFININLNGMGLDFLFLTQRWELHFFPCTYVEIIFVDRLKLWLQQDRTNSFRVYIVPLHRLKIPSVHAMNVYYLVQSLCSFGLDNVKVRAWIQPK